MSCVFFQAEDGIRDLVRSRGLGDVYKRQVYTYLRTAIVSEQYAPDARLVELEIANKMGTSQGLSLIHI